ncbi:hypothetical protein C0075_25055, partial [Rhizobium sp. KAs_5_22]
VNQLISMIPNPVLGGISLMLFGIIATNGVRIMLDAKVNLENGKNLIIIGITLGLGLGISLYTASTNTQIKINDFELSGLFIATVVG